MSVRRGTPPILKYNINVGGASARWTIQPACSLDNPEILERIRILDLNGIKDTPFFHCAQFLRDHHFYLRSYIKGVNGSSLRAISVSIFLRFLNSERVPTLYKNDRRSSVALPIADTNHRQISTVNNSPSSLTIHHPAPVSFPISPLCMYMVTQDKHHGIHERSYNSSNWVQFCGENNSPERHFKE